MYRAPIEQKHPVAFSISLRIEASPLVDESDPISNPWRSLEAPPPLPELIDFKAAKLAGHPIQKNLFLERDGVPCVHVFSVSGLPTAGQERSGL